MHAKDAAQDAHAQPKLNGEYPIVHASFDDDVESFVLSPFGDSF